jgi:hypothetical protein
MRSTRSNLIRPLRSAENVFLQTLLTRFELTRTESGAALGVEINERTPSIWNSDAKSHLRRSIKGFVSKAQKYQRELDRFLIGGIGERYSFNDPAFPFRFASGGTLPVIRMGDNDYYCLFYRDIPPVGWNIANGGCDSRHELLHPLETVERELREELIIVQPRRGHRYAFHADERKPIDHPDFAVAWSQWQTVFHRVGYRAINEWELLPMKWLSGPDTVTVEFAGFPEVRSEGCFLNINAEDFGIEVDRIAKLNIDEDAIVCDGELLGGRLLDQVVGLFEVKRFNHQLWDCEAPGAREFVPDIAFQRAERYEGKDFMRAVRRYLKTRESDRSSASKRAYVEWPAKFDLCPVTRRIVNRYLTLPATPPPVSAVGGQRPAVFISFASEDKRLAKRVWKHLLASTGRPVFFSDEGLHQSNFGRAIDDALDDARCLVAVGTKLHHLLKGWPEYEWRSFHNDIRSGRKRDANLFSFVSIDANDLPRPLRNRQAVVHKPSDRNTALKRLGSAIVNSI